MKCVVSKSKGKYLLTVDGGDLYLRKNVIWDKDLGYCLKKVRADLLKSNRSSKEKLNIIKIMIRYSCPEEEDIENIKQNKLKKYSINSNHLFKVNLFEFDKKTKQLTICEEFWSGYESECKALIKKLNNLSKIYFIGRHFENEKDGYSLADDMDDELIRHSYKNPNWEDEMILDPAEDPDDLEQLIALKNEVGPKVRIEFNYLSEDSEKLLKDNGII